MKVILIGFACLFLATAVFSQNGGRIGGTVTDKGVQVADATVTATRKGHRTPTYTVKTNASGEYIFDLIEPGEYTITATIQLNETMRASRRAERISVTHGQLRIVDLALEELPILTEKVNIAADDDQTVEQVSKSVNVITGQEMRDRADITLADSLRTIPGFRVQQLGGFGRIATIKSRGLRNHDTAILIDGIRFRDATAITGDASPFLSDFTLTSVSKIEVLRGPGSSLYGTNAVGGTVDFQTPTPQNGWHGQVSGAAGGLGLGRFRGNISKGTSDGKFGFNIGVSRTAFTKGIDGEDNANNTNFQSRVEFNPTSKTNISARFFVSDAFVRLNSNPDTVGDPPLSNSTIVDANPGVNFVFDANDADAIQNSDFFNGQIVISHAFNSKFDFQGYYSGLNTSRTNENGTLGVGFQSASTSIFDGQIHDANGRFRWTPSAINTVTFGYEFEQEKFGNDGFTPDGSGDFFTRASQTSHTIFAQDLISLLDGNLQFAGGFRAQFFSLGAPEFSILNAPYSDLVLSNPPSAITFDGSASYFFQSTGTKLRVHAGSGYRVPSLFERFGSFFSSFGEPAFFALGDPFLKPEKTWAFDGGIEQNIFGDKARLSAVYFYSKLDETIGFGNEVPDIGDTERPFGGYMNTKGGIARGAEFSATVRPTDTTNIFVSYTFTNSDQREPQVTGSGIFTTLGIPENQFTAVVTQRFGRFWVNFDLLATDDYLAPIFSNSTFNTYVYRFRGNRRADLTAGYTFPISGDKFNLRIFGTIENLFDYEYFENGFRTVGRNGRLGVSFGF